MTREDWLKQKHADLDKKVTELEAQRKLYRNFDHKALLLDLKKQRLEVKTELQSLQNA